MRSRRGFTLVEVLVAAILGGIIAASLATAFAITVRHEEQFGFKRRDFEASIVFENRLRDILSRAYFDPDAGENTFFEPTSQTGDSSYADTLNFTVIGQRVSDQVLIAEETEFESRNSTMGPIGGLQEISLSMTPAGDSGGASGLFLRRQSPPDSDHFSGGIETVLGSEVQTFSLEFWDSTAWVSTWDTASLGRLPSAIRVHYLLNGDDQSEKVFDVVLKNAPQEGTQ